MPQAPAAFARSRSGVLRSNRRAVAVSVLGLLGLGTLLLTSRRRLRPAGKDGEGRTATATPAAIDAARQINAAAGMIAASVLADSAIEHYRGSFHNKAMVAPLVTGALSLAVSIHGNSDDRPVAHGLRDAIYVAAIATGAVGTGFHLYNVGKRPGGWAFQNLFYAAPLGAPAALILSGMAGFVAERVRSSSRSAPPQIAGLPAGRVVAAATGIGLLGTAAEAGLLHFRGAFQNPFMYLPVTLPPAAALVLGCAALARGAGRHPVSRTGLQATAAMGLAGAGFHIYGVGRSMGGWRNWTQNLLDGPPIPAPPSFTGLALAGLAALGLMEEHPDD